MNSTHVWYQAVAVSRLTQAGHRPQVGLQALRTISTLTDVHASGLRLNDLRLNRCHSRIIPDNPSIASTAQGTTAARRGIADASWSPLWARPVE